MNKFIRPATFLFFLFVFAVYAGFIREDKTGHDHHHDHTDVYRQHSHSEAVELPEKLLFPSREPDRVILNLTEDPETSLAVNWRTDTTVAEGFVEFAVSTAGPEFINLVTRTEAKKQSLNTKHLEEPSISAHYFSVKIDNLTPGEKYLYRAGTDGAWSEWFQVQMPDVNTGELSFVYFGDAQNDLKSMWSRVIREAYKTIPQVDFMLHAGDLINRHDRDLEWGEWFYAGSFIHATVPSVMTPGNHVRQGCSAVASVAPAIQFAFEWPERTRGNLLLRQFYEP